MVLGTHRPGLTWEQFITVQAHAILAVDLAVRPR
jgi:hypothetical protein